MNYEKPISTFGYIGYFFLYSIPLLGIIALIMNAFSAKNVNLRNYSRALFIIILLTYFLSFAIVAMAFVLSSYPEYETLGTFNFFKVVESFLARV